MINYTQVIEIVANTFINEYIKDGNFKTFQEMCDCYCYNSADIKKEVNDILTNTTNYMACISEDDDREVIIGDEIYSYREFISDVKKEIKRNGF